MLVIRSAIAFALFGLLAASAVADTPKPAAGTPDFNKCTK
jgi:hypothetical protein